MERLSPRVTPAGEASSEQGRPTMTPEQLEKKLRALGYPVTPSGTTNNEGCAAELGIEPPSLPNKRLKFKGPRWSVINGRAWYDLRDIIEWKEADAATNAAKRDARAAARLERERNRSCVAQTVSDIHAVESSGHTAE